jgi:hypothetical protein
MNRNEKLDTLYEFLDEGNFKIIDVTSIGAVIVDAELVLVKEENEDEYNELLEKGLEDSDIYNLKTFLDENNLMIIKNDEITGVSFENAEYYIDGLSDTELWLAPAKTPKEDDLEEDKKE